MLLTTARMLVTCIPTDTTTRHAEHQDSIEADSIVKSAKKADPTLSLGDSDSALEGTRAEDGTGSDAGQHHTAPVLGQQQAVAGSLNHLSENVVTAAKGGTMDDPEQAFTQGKIQSITCLCICGKCLCISHCVLS